MGIGLELPMPWGFTHSISFDTGVGVPLASEGWLRGPIAEDRLPWSRKRTGRKVKLI